VTIQISSTVAVCAEGPGMQQPSSGRQCVSNCQSSVRGHRIIFKPSQSVMNGKETDMEIEEGAALMR